MDPKDYATSSCNDGIVNSGQKKKIDTHSLRNTDLNLTQEQVQANKRLRSPSKQSPCANKRHSPRNHPPILHKLDTNKVSITSSKEIDTETLLVSQDKALTFSEPLKSKLHLGMKHSADLLGKFPISNFSSPEEAIMREQQNNNISKYLLMFQKNYIEHEVINIILSHTNSPTHTSFLYHREIKRYLLCNKE